MAVVIRLQGLRVTAGTEDIRKLFTGLKIPDGGVHIIGGEREEAFIIFASDEDARRAMTRSGGCIKGSPVTLLLSSKAEMQNMLERSTKNVELDQKRHFKEIARGARRSLHPEAGRGSGSISYHTNDDFFGVFLKGMPFSVTEKDVRDFFSGLSVDDIILRKNKHGANNGTGLVKFQTREDVIEALKRDRRYIGSRYVEISTTTADDWHRVASRVPIVSRDNSFKRERSPLRNTRNPQHVRSQSPLAQRSMPHSDEEYCVLLDNLSYAVEKEDIKRLFLSAKLQDDQILHLIGRDGKRTRSAFVLFKSLHDYCDALAAEKKQFFNRLLYVRPISRENMIILLESQSTDVRTPQNSKGFQDGPPSYPSDLYDSGKTCLSVWNLPFDVRKVEIMDFFCGFNITEDKVFLLRDHEGAGVGKALVLFQSEAEAMGALSLSGRRFLGSEVILKCISRSEIQQLVNESTMGQEPAEQASLSREERYFGSSSGASYHPGDTEYSDLRISHDCNTPVIGIKKNAHGARGYKPYGIDPCASHDRGNGVHGSFGGSVQHFDGVTCVKLVNLPFQIRNEEIYDFFYGYCIIPGSVTLQYDQGGKPKGSATVVFESHQEAMTAIAELSGRAIGPRKIQLLLV
uniref:RRM domain-containing protein n=1 Tax=Monopterus albus TaxID=43700 RepID=A0A3Q3QPS5_MONAL